MPGQLSNGREVTKHFAGEHGAEEILEYCERYRQPGQANLDESTETETRKILQVNRLHLTWDASDWSIFQDDAYASALIMIGNKGHLDELCINFVGEARFTEHDYVMISPPQKLPEHFLLKVMPEICSSFPERTKGLAQRPTVDMAKYDIRFHIRRKVAVEALLNLRNIPKVSVTGPITVDLRRRIFAQLPCEPASAETQIRAGLIPPETLEETNAIDEWEREISTARLGEDVVRICTRVTANDEEQNELDEEAWHRLFGQRKAGTGILASDKLGGSFRDNNWIPPTSKCGEVIIGWRADGRMPAWQGYDELQ
ncbi:MAG: hypothetical protein M1820_004697 [Bogoriella megaspora]|nr:MAG: hypothetical protein M1820_004697 [Bogoriella megaspora]